MNLRITDTSTQVAAVIVASVFAIFAGVSVTLVVGLASGPAVLNALVLGAVGAVARTFRSPGEEVTPPRPWWRLTGRAATGYVWAAVFLTHSASLGIMAAHTDQPASYAVTAVLYAALAALFLHSSIRLSRPATTPVAAGF